MTNVSLSIAPTNGNLRKCFKVANPGGVASGPLHLKARTSGNYQVSKHAKRGNFAKLVIFWYLLYAYTEIGDVMLYGIMLVALAWILLIPATGTAFVLVLIAGAMTHLIHGRHWLSKLQRPSKPSSAPSAP
jgi:hypothetical protein